MRPPSTPPCGSELRGAAGGKVRACVTAEAAPCLPPAAESPSGAHACGQSADHCPARRRERGCLRHGHRASCAVCAFRSAGRAESPWKQEQLCVAGGPLGAAGKRASGSLVPQSASSPPPPNTARPCSQHPASSEALSQRRPDCHLCVTPAVGENMRFVAASPSPGPGPPGRGRRGELALPGANSLGVR